MTALDVPPSADSRSASADIFARSERVIPGGVNSPVRAFGAVGGTPVVAARGEGAYLFDEDGNRYIDLVQSWGALPLGHAHPAVVAAARGALERGSTFGAPTRGELELAETLVEAVPSLEQVRLVSSGTEAAMSAIRLARGATGRTRIVKFAGHYHGHSDGLLVDAGSGVATLGIPGSPGVTPGAAADTLSLPWNDVQAVREAVDLHGDVLAAIVCEPLAANTGLMPADPGFLEALRDEASRCGALLIFDEVITGFRVARGGVQERSGVTPDLTVLGKVIGGGFPLAAFGGRREIMGHLAPSGAVYQAGTLSGNPVAVAAGSAQLAELDDAAYERLRRTAADLARGLQSAFDDAGVTAVVSVEDTLVGVLFGRSAPPRDDRDVRAADHALYGRFFHAMLERGVYLAPSGYEVLFPSLAHDAAVIDEVVGAATDAARALAR